MRRTIPKSREKSNNDMMIWTGIKTNLHKNIGNTTVISPCGYTSLQLSQKHGVQFNDLLQIRRDRTGQFRVDTP